MKQTRLIGYIVFMVVCGNGVVGYEDCAGVVEINQDYCKNMIFCTHALMKRNEL